MNQKATYEITITEKLKQLPLPDLADAIWSRIETELDTDMPTDDGGDSTLPSAPKGGWMVQFALPAIVVLTVTLFLTKKTEKQKTPIIPPSTYTAVPAPDSADSISLKNKAAPFINLQTNKLLRPVDNTRIDSAFIEPPSVVSMPFVPTDSAQQMPSPLVQTLSPLSRDTTAKKKRGVTGIGDSVYRIVPKRDSLP